VLNLTQAAEQIANVNWHFSSSTRQPGLSGDRRRSSDEAGRGADGRLATKLTTVADDGMAQRTSLGQNVYDHRLRDLEGLRRRTGCPAPEETLARSGLRLGQPRTRAM